MQTKDVYITKDGYIINTTNGIREDLCVVVDKLMIGKYLTIGLMSVVYLRLLCSVGK